VVGRQPNAPAAFTPGDMPGTHFQRLSRPQGTWFCRGVPRKKSPVTPPGIDPGTVRLVAQHILQTQSVRLYNVTNKETKAHQYNTLSRVATHRHVSLSSAATVISVPQWNTNSTQTIAPNALCYDQMGRLRC